LDLVQNLPPIVFVAEVEGAFQESTPASGGTIMS